MKRVLPTMELRVGDIWEGKVITRIEPPTNLSHLRDWSWLLFLSNGECTSSMGVAQWLVDRREESADLPADNP